MPEPLSFADVRLRYFEWCAAKVAIRMASLSPEEIWVYAFTAPASGFPDGAPPPGGAPSFDQALRRAIAGVARDLDLPKFEDWALRYAVDPEPFDRLIRQFTSSSLSPWGDDVRPSAW